MAEWNSSDTFLSISNPPIPLKQSPVASYPPSAPSILVVKLVFTILVFSCCWDALLHWYLLNLMIVKASDPKKAVKMKSKAYRISTNETRN